MQESILSAILTGILSGIISSIIVTQYYRKKDSEKDKTRYFEDVYDFYCKLNSQLKVASNLDKIIELRSIKMPKLFSWILVDYREKTIIRRLERIYYSVSIIADKIEEIQSEDEKRAVYLSYLSDLNQYQEELKAMFRDIYGLVYSEREKLDREEAKGK